MEQSIDRFKALQTQVSSLNNKIIEANAKREVHQKQLSEILEKYKVKTVDEFKTLFAQKKQVIDSEVVRMEAFITEVSPKLQSLDSTIHSVDL